LVRNQSCNARAVANLQCQTKLDQVSFGLENIDLFAKQFQAIVKLRKVFGGSDFRRA